MLSSSLKDAVRHARIESAERNGVVLEMRDAERARLEILNEALDPVFSEIPSEIELFDRGISSGDTPRLWIDAVAHVEMARDKRHYRLVQDGRFGRKTLAETNDLEEMVDAVTHYIASRLVERERALADRPSRLYGAPYATMRDARAHQRWRLIRMFIFGLIVGAIALFAAIWIVAWQSLS